MDNFNKDDDYLIIVFIIGFIASILNFDHVDYKRAKYKILSFLLSSLSSMFLCWMSYEIFFYFLIRSGFLLLLLVLLRGVALIG